MASRPDDIYHCVICGIHLFDTSPQALAKHAAHNREFAAEIQQKVDDARDLVQGG